MQPVDAERRQRLWHAHGGRKGAPPFYPSDVPQWRPGMPVHWQEQTTFMRVKAIVVRVFSALHLAVSVVYLQFRARHTIGVFARSRLAPLLTYQIAFFLLEVFNVFSTVFRLIEAWNICSRNSVDLKRIPNALISPYFMHSAHARVPPDYCNYPSVGVFIPCYNEQVDLITDTLVAALSIDYPPQLLTVYLCDDGKDPLKRGVVSHLRKKFPNVHYVIRPVHEHAKAGNLNYALERTTTDLVVTLDADFVARPNLLQRLVPYYFVWNPTIGMYEFNGTLAVVQVPQHFRNLSPYDSDPLDQRGIFFFDLVLPGKDWFNASTMVGTTNLINRAALKHANYYPYHSITEDTALTVMLHGLGYRTYFVNESLATGLCTTTLWANLGQRARWLKGDWQILFSKHGALTQKGLSFVQRMMYFNMCYMRIISIVHMCYDVAVILLLTLGISPLDAVEPIRFLAHLGAFILSGVVFRYIVNVGGGGLDKSESGNVAFEAIFRYITLKGLFIALFMGDKVRFKVTDKTGAARLVRKGEKEGTTPAEEEEDGVDGEIKSEAGELFTENPRQTVLGCGGPGQVPMGIERAGAGGGADEMMMDVDVDVIVTAPEAVVLNMVEIGGSPPAEGAGQGSATSSSNHSEWTEDDARNTKMCKKRRSRTPTLQRSAEQKRARRGDIRRNLKRTWFNAVMAALLSFGIVWALVRPPRLLAAVGPIVTIGGQEGRFSFDNAMPMGLAVGFAAASLLPHLLALVLCFVPYVSGWMMSDLVRGRCDQWAVHPKTGKLFVPFSFISLLTAARVALMVGALVVVSVAAFQKNEGQFVPLTAL